MSLINGVRLPSLVRRGEFPLLLATVLTCFFWSGLGRAETPTEATNPFDQYRVKMVHSFRSVAVDGEVATNEAGRIVRGTLTAEETSTPMEVQLTLPLRNADELERRVAAGETISRREMDERFLPTTGDYQIVADWAKSRGLTVSPVGAGRMMVIAVGTPTQLASVFETKFARVKYHGEEHTSATAAPSVPAAIKTRIHSIHGLQPHLHPRKHITVNPIDMANGSPPFLPDDILKAYDITPTGLDGTGQTIAIIIDTVPFAYDLQHFWRYNGVPQTLDNYSTVNVENRTIPPPTGEETLDVEWSSGLASGAKIVVYACGDLVHCNDAYSRVLDDLQSGAQTTLHQMSISFGAGEISDETSDDISAVHSLFTAITAYGVTIFASSGDKGAYGNDEGKVEAIYPASDPVVTGVGGTRLSVNTSFSSSPTSSYADEYAWGITGDPNQNHDSSGGGISVYFSRPSWQVGRGVLTDAMRQVPDVALDADPISGYKVYFYGKDGKVGGTSVSAPCWAGICAIINQARAAKGLPAMTNFNAAVYPLLGTSSFHSNYGGGDGVYTGGPGVYNLLTGIGTPDVAKLVQSLTSPGVHPSFYSGEVPLSQGVYYLAFANGNVFGYYEYLSTPNFIYHFDLGFEYHIDAADGHGGIYFYDFTSNTFWYTSPTFSFPYLYDFSLQAFLYYYPDPSNPQRYDTNGVRYFYNFSTGKVISK